jgi:hypothetical protein
MSSRWRSWAASSSAKKSGATSRISALPHQPMCGVNPISITAWPSVNAAMRRPQSARRAMNNSCQRISSSAWPSAGSAVATITPHSSSSVAASRSGPRRASPRAMARTWRRFSAVLARGQASQASALNQSCQFCGRVGTSPVAPICIS